MTDPSGDITDGMCGFDAGGRLWIGFGDFIWWFETNHDDDVAILDHAEHIDGDLDLQGRDYDQDGLPPAVVRNVERAGFNPRAGAACSEEAV